MTTRKTQTPAPSAASKSAKPATRSAAKPVTQSAAKSVKKSANKPTAAPVRGKTVQAASQPAAKAAPPNPKAQKAEKLDKARKPKMVRDSFTMPKAEYAAIEALKERATQAGRPAKKSELLRAGVKLLEALPPSALVAALQALPAIKTGRPAKS